MENKRGRCGGGDLESAERSFSLGVDVDRGEEVVVVVVVVVVMLLGVGLRGEEFEV